MSYKAVLAGAFLFTAAYPPTRAYTVQIACEASPDAMIQKAQSFIPAPQSFWDNVNAVASGNFGPPPSSPVFRHIWDLEKSSAAIMASYLSEGKASTFASVCPTQAQAQQSAGP